MLGSWWLSPAGSQGARPGQPHEPQLIHTTNAMRTHSPDLLACTHLLYYQTAKTGCVCVKEMCRMTTIIKHSAKWDGYNSLTLIKIDMLLIIFKPDSLLAHPASCTLLCKINNNHGGQQSFLCFPKSNC